MRDDRVAVLLEDLAFESPYNVYMLGDYGDPGFIPLLDEYLDIVERLGVDRFVHGIFVETIEALGVEPGARPVAHSGLEERLRWLKAPGEGKIKRNALCWCGSGKKYKKMSLDLGSLDRLCPDGRQGEAASWRV